MQTFWDEMRGQHISEPSDQEPSAPGCQPLFARGLEALNHDGGHALHRSHSRRETKAKFFLFRFDAQRSANVLCGKHPGGRLHNTVEIGFGQVHALVTNGVNAKAPLQQLFDELLARDWIVGAVVVRLGVPAELGGVLNGVFR
jgi:hypothetical protein